ncbi:MarR family winged helix-turn-helix transcriptional regulator [Undibacter mobilis]|uniref:MarR family transcriptional regulator n=1 Tax=Undibacter mobilis TaxID=2292256 RepID=A0A371B384_9BRAD|nr:MarR family transcriptional regulator [Undibacter mobilis]RDV01913.1 MarR family transcriptional regulator [Undibacter mobilis]
MTEQLPADQVSTHRIHEMPGHLIRRLHQIAVGLFSQATKSCALTPVQYAVLAVLQNNPGISQRALADLVALDRSTIGEVILRLEEKGCVAREASPTDKRIRCLTLTETGVSLLQAMDALMPQSQIDVLAPLSEGEQAIFMYLLKKLVRLNNDASPSPLRLKAP